MSAQGDKFRNRPEEDQPTRRTAEDELMRGDRPSEVDSHGESGGSGSTSGGAAASGSSGTAGGGIENEGTGSLIVHDRESGQNTADTGGERQGGSAFSEDTPGSGSTKGGSASGVSGQRGMTGGLEKEGKGHSGPIRSGSGKDQPHTEQDRAAAGEADTNAREGYEDHGGSRDEDGTRGESSGSRPGYR